VRVSPGVLSEHLQQVLGSARRQSKTVCDFEFCYHPAKAPPFLRGRFVGEHDDEIHVGCL
jgi:hypothetical protein